MTTIFDPRKLLHALVAHEVRFVIIGGLAGVLHGSPALTFDLDICHDRDRKNLDALAAALRDMKATLRGAPPSLPFLLDGKTLQMGDSFTFATTSGDLDCLGTPAGTNGYTDLVSSAIEVTVDGDLLVQVCALDDLLRMKRAAGRTKDLLAIEILTALKEERDSPGESAD